MTIQPVDDVTEIILKQERVVYRQGTSGCSELHAFRISQLGQARLDDPDTACFDGGELTCAITAGGVKGDVFSILTTEQQEKQYEMCDRIEVTDEVTSHILDTRPIIEAEVIVPEEGAEQKTGALPDKRLFHNGTQVATLMYCRSKSYSSAGIFDLKVSFTKPVVVPEGEEPVMLAPLWLASYIINILTFANMDNEKPRDGVRSVRLAICDPENPVPGKASLQVQVLSPTISISHAPEVSANVGTDTCLAPKMISLVSDKAFVMRGFCEVVILNPEEQDLLTLSQKSGLVMKDSGLLDGPKFIGKVETSPHMIRVDFSVQSKASRESLQRFVRGVNITLAPTGGDRQVRFTLCDKQAEPNVITLTVKKKMMEDLMPIMKAAGKLRGKK